MKVSATLESWILSFSFQIPEIVFPFSVSIPFIPLFSANLLPMPTSQQSIGVLYPLLRYLPFSASDKKWGECNTRPLVTSFASSVYSLPALFRDPSAEHFLQFLLINTPCFSVLRVFKVCNAPVSQFSL